MHLEQLIKEKDSEIRMQALKIKELVYAGGPMQIQAIVKKDYMTLASLSNPNKHQNV